MDLTISAGVGRARPDRHLRRHRWELAGNADRRIANANLLPDQYARPKRYSNRRQHCYTDHRSDDRADRYDHARDALSRAGA